MDCEIVNGHWCKNHLGKAVEFLAKSRLDRSVATDVAEFGVYRGESLRLIGELFYQHQIPLGTAWGFDSFQGLPDEAPGVDRFYLFNKGMFADVGQLWAGRNMRLVKGWFSELGPQTVTDYGLKPFSLVHIDGDLYISAKQALEFVFANNLVRPGTVIAYDEFKSTGELTAGGESKAHVEVAEKFKVSFREFYRHVYFDRLECWQNAFVVESIGREANHGIHGVA